MGLPRRSVAPSCVWREPGEKAGSYGIKAKSIKATGNYEVTYVPAEFVIRPVYEGSSIIGESINRNDPPRTTATNLEEIAHSFLTDSERQALKAGAGARIWIDVAGLGKGSVPSADRAKLEEAAKKLGLTPARWMDISLFKDVTGFGVTQIHDTAVPVELVTEVPRDLRKDGRVFYRDLFMLSFYLCGIRPTDLLHARRDQVVDGRLVYKPEKLNGRTKLSVKIEPEAWEIIRKYEGKELLLDILERRNDYKSFMAHWNRALKAIGDDERYYKVGRKGRVYAKTRHIGIVPYITVYFARSCWASYCYNMLDVPMDIISQGLGHKSGLRVTNFYVKRGED